MRAVQASNVVFLSPGFRRRPEVSFYAFPGMRKPFRYYFKTFWKIYARNLDF
ncbi:hypothetical protein OBV_02520 [Oscillibacter valericigenes Sjm18-20]|nr:hypothetical protein OBV_02520 [Oscillibacter valericigenes Sjm18-20]